MDTTLLKALYSAMIFSALNFLYSCTDVQFDAPQPAWVVKNEKEIPQNLRGEYLSGKDTIRITEKRIVDNKVNHFIDYSISDSVLLKIYHHTYFLNILHREQKTWSVIMAKQDKEKILYYMIPEDDQGILKQLEEITQARETRDSAGKVINCVINPTSREFRQILKKKLFTISEDTLKKIR